MTLTIETERELAGLETKLAGLKEYASRERARELFPIIKRTGWYKGEVKDLTKGQYRKLLGKEPKKAIIVKGKIPWEYAFDELATELHYPSDEALRKEVEKVGKAMHELKELETDIKMAKERAKEAKKGKIELGKRYHFSINGTLPAKEVFIGGEEAGIAIRYPSSWGIVPSVNGVPKEAIAAPVAQTRYAKDIKKQVKKVLGRNNPNEKGDQKKMKSRTKKWGKIGAPKSAKRRRFLAGIRKKK